MKTRPSLILCCISLMLHPGIAAPPAEAPAAGEGVRRIEYNEGNAQIDWAVIKTIVGKRVRVVGGWDDVLRDGPIGRIDGHLDLNAEGEPVELRAEVGVASLWTVPESLTKYIFSCGFFDPEKHPTAHFASSSITPLPSPGKEASDPTHEISGTMTINGIARPLKVPARFVPQAGGMNVRATFTVNRQEFACRLVEAPRGIFLGDKDIEDSVSITFQLDTPRALRKRHWTAQEIAALPGSITETIPSIQIRMEMVRVVVPGPHGPRPLYVARREASWDEIMPWANAAQPGQTNAWKRPVNLRLHPSLPAPFDLSEGRAMNGHPARFLTLKSARGFCQWLRRETDRPFRLPTREEWLAVHQASRQGLDPLSDDEARRIAVYEQTAPVDPDQGTTHPAPCASKLADRLGLYDLLGNVAEWTSDASAMGGSYFSTLPKIQYPEEDVPIANRIASMDWWQSDANAFGFRVVLDPGERMPMK